MKTFVLISLLDKMDPTKIYAKSKCQNGLETSIFFSLVSYFQTPGRQCDALDSAESKCIGYYRHFKTLQLISYI